MGIIKNKSIVKIIGFILIVNVILSLILTFTKSGNPQTLIRFIDNLFLIGVNTLLLSFIIAIVRFVYAIKNREILKNELSKEEKGKTKTITHEEQIFFREELLHMFYKAFSRTGLICIVLTLIVGIFI